MIKLAYIRVSFEINYMISHSLPRFLKLIIEKVCLNLFSNCNLNCQRVSCSKIVISFFFHSEILPQASLKENQIVKLSHLEFSKMGEIIALVNATKYSRMDQVKFVEDSL